MIIRYRPLPTILSSCAQIQVVHPRRPVVNNVKRIVYVVSDDFVVGLVRGEFDISVSCLLLQAPTLYLLIQGWHLAALRTLALSPYSRTRYQHNLS